MSSSLELMAAHLDRMATAERHAGQTPTERKRQVLRAVQARDMGGLWSVVVSYLILHGRRGARISPGTLDKYQRALKRYWAWCDTQAVDLTRPGPDTGRAFLRHLEAQGLVESSVRWHRAACLALYECLRWCGVRTDDPFQDARPAPDPRDRLTKGKLYTLEEIAALLQVASQEEAVIITLGADCGLRAAEIAGLRRVHVHLDGDEPHVFVEGKGAKSREQVLSRRAEGALRTWLALTGHVRSEYVLLAHSVDKVQDAMRRVCGRAGISYDKRTVHGLRRTAGTRAYAESQDLLETRDFLGHRAVAATEIYVRYARRAGKAVNRDW